MAKVSVMMRMMESERETGIEVGRGDYSTWRGGRLKDIAELVDEHRVIETLVLECALTRRTREQRSVDEPMI